MALRPAAQQVRAARAAALRLPAQRLAPPGQTRGGRRDRGRPPNPRDGGRLQLVPFEADSAFALVAGQWRYIEFAPFPVRAHQREANGFFPVPQATDAIFDLIFRADAIRFYGRAAYAQRVRPATRAEIRRFCTKGGVPDLV